MKSSPLSSQVPAVLSWVLQLAIVVILGMTLPFKFSGAEESVALFTQVGIEPWGRYLTGAGEAVAVVLLLIPALAWLGAAVAVGLLVGAIGAHLTTPLGVAPDLLNTGQGDPTLFILAVLSVFAGLGILFLRRTQLPIVGSRFAKNETTSEAASVSS